MKIGFIGLGNVGAKLAKSLLRNKFNLTVRDLNEKLTKEFLAEGALISNSPKDLTKNVDLIITCLPSPKACSEVMEGEDGVIKALTKNNVSVNIKNKLI